MIGFRFKNVILVFFVYCSNSTPYDRNIRSCYLKTLKKRFSFPFDFIASTSHLHHSCKTVNWFIPSKSVCLYV